MSRRLLLILLAVAFLPSLLSADVPSKAPASLSDRMPGLEFRNIGPFRGGRVTAVTGVRGESLTFYQGATGGGVWKTTDGGETWRVVSDGSFTSGSVGAVAVAESDPNVVYVGTGEAPIRGNVSHGDGIYRSTDAGRTWTNVGLKDTQQIARVRVHPRNPDLVYVAAQGHVWGPNAERGIFRSTDGGKAWSKILFVDDKTGASDLAMDPTNPRILYAAFWQVYRRPWTLQSGGPGGGLYKTTDGGDTWKQLGGGLPEGLVGKCAVAVAPSRPSRVYAMVEAEKGGLFRSDDGGETWALVSDSHRIRQRAWYYSWIFVDPANADVVYAPNVQFMKSIDGGKTFTSVRVRHGDVHDMWIDPDDPARFILGDDGGAEITVNGGQSWSTEDNQPTGQFYRVVADNRFPYWIYGSQQDNTTVAIPSGVRGPGILPTDWHEVGGGESGWIAPDPRNPDIVYAGSYGGSITRHDHKTGETREIIAWPQVIDGRAARDLKYRFQWTAPIVLSPHDPDTLYHAAQVLLRSRDQGQTWEEISPDLTRDDKARQDYSGGPISREITGVETYDTIFALVASPHEAGTIWVGTDDGLVQLTRDGGRTWQNVTPKGIPEWIRINNIDVSPHDKGTAFVAATMYQHDDLRPYLYKTTDYGATWTKIVSGIPDTAFTRVVREDPGRRGLLVAGTETGLYVSFDAGASWTPFQRNLPAVPITDLVFKDSDLVLATQGRGFWILDDLTPLRAWKPGSTPAPGELLPPRPTVRYPFGTSSRKDIGTNRPGGVIVNYWLDTKPAKDEVVTLEFLEGRRLIRTFSSAKPTPKSDSEKAEAEAEEAEEDESPLEPKAGLNRFVWDLREMAPTLTVPRFIYGDFPPEGIRVTPGTYTVRLTAGGRTVEQPFEVRPNPTLNVPVADVAAQAAFLRKVQSDLLLIHDILRRSRDIKAQVTGLARRAAAIGKADMIRPKADGIVEKLEAIERELYNPQIKTSQDSLNFLPKLDFQFAGLAGMSDTADARPTAAAERRYDELKGELTALIGRVQQVIDTDVGDFNAAVIAAGIPAVIVPAPGARR